MAQTLLSQYYAGYSKSFPDPKGRDSLSHLSKCLERCPTFEIEVLEQKNKIVGGIHYVEVSTRDLAPHSKESSSVFIEYFWIASDIRMSGVGRNLLESVSRTFQERGAEFILLELLDPERIDEDHWLRDSASGVTPRDRLNFWARNHFLRVDLEYLRPDEYGMNQVCDYEMLAIRFLNDATKELSAETFSETLQSYFSSMYNIDSPTEDSRFQEHFRRMLSNSLVPLTPLVPLSTPRLEEER